MKPVKSVNELPPRMKKAYEAGEKAVAKGQVVSEALKKAGLSASQYYTARKKLGLRETKPVKAEPLKDVLTHQPNPPLIALIGTSQDVMTALEKIFK